MSSSLLRRDQGLRQRQLSQSAIACEASLCRAASKLWSSTILSSTSDMPAHPPEHLGRIHLSGTNSLIEQVSAIAKSTAPFSETIQALAHILKIPKQDLSTVQPLRDELQENRKTYEPVDEWAFRWLLKNLNTAIVDATTPRPECLRLDSAADCGFAFANRCGCSSCC